MCRHQILQGHIFHLQNLVSPCDIVFSSLQSGRYCASFVVITQQRFDHSTPAVRAIFSSSTEFKQQLCLNNTKQRTIFQPIRGTRSLPASASMLLRQQSKKPLYQSLYNSTVSIASILCVLFVLCVLVDNPRRSPFSVIVLFTAFIMNIQLFFYTQNLIHCRQVNIFITVLNNRLRNVEILIVKLFQYFDYSL